MGERVVVIPFFLLYANPPLFCSGSKSSYPVTWPAPCASADTSASRSSSSWMVVKHMRPTTTTSATWWGGWKLPTRRWYWFSNTTTYFPTRVPGSCRLFKKKRESKCSSIRVILPSSLQWIMFSLTLKDSWVLTSLIIQVEPQTLWPGSSLATSLITSRSFTSRCYATFQTSGGRLRPKTYATFIRDDLMTINFEKILYSSNFIYN